MKKTENTIHIFGRDIPLTNSGKINQTFLTKSERTAYKALLEDKEKKKEALMKEELERLFNK
jgi:hypothetical protein